MGFRFRRSARLGPLRFHFGKGGLSSVSLGGRGASLNIPVGRRGGTHTTLGLPGTGLSWSAEQGSGGSRPGASSPEALGPETPGPVGLGPAAGLPNSRRLRAGQLEGLRRDLLTVLQTQLFAPGSAAWQLWDLGLVSRLLAEGSLAARTAGLLALIETPEALEGYLLRARSQDDAKRRARRCLAAAQEATRLAAARGWIGP